MSGTPDAIRRVGDRAAVRRPVRRQVHRAVDRDAARIGAVVVRDVDLLDVALLDGARPPLRDCDPTRTSAWSAPRRAACAATRAARRTWCARRDAGWPPSRCTRGRRPDCRARTLYSRISTRMPVADLLHRADHHAVGAELAPAIVRHRVDRRRRRNRSCRCRAGSCRTRARSSGRPTAPGRSTSRRVLRLAIARQRQQVGHRHPRLRAGVAGESRCSTLVGCCGGGCGGGGCCAATTADAATISGAEQLDRDESSWSLVCLSACNRNTRCTASAGSGYAAGSGGSFVRSKRAPRDRSPAPRRRSTCSTVISTMRPSFWMTNRIVRRAGGALLAVPVALDRARPSSSGIRDSRSSATSRWPPAPPPPDDRPKPMPLAPVSAMLVPFCTSAPFGRLACCADPSRRPCSAWSSSAAPWSARSSPAPSPPADAPARSPSSASTGRPAESSGRRASPARRRSGRSGRRG